jgi:hypothetical protein
MERTMNDNVIKNLVGRHVEKHGGFNRLGCLAVVEIPRLMNFYYGTEELTINELLRLEDTLVNERKAGEF